MVNFGTELSRLYEDIARDRSSRIAAAEDRVEGVFRIAERTRELLSDCRVRRDEIRGELGAEARALRERLQSSMADLRNDLHEFRERAHAEATVRRDARRQATERVRQDLAAFREKLSIDATARRGANEDERTLRTTALREQLDRVAVTTRSAVSNLKSAIAEQKTIARQQFSAKGGASPVAASRKESVAPASMSAPVARKTASEPSVTEMPTAASAPVSRFSDEPMTRPASEPASAAITAPVPDQSSGKSDGGSKVKGALASDSSAAQKPTDQSVAKGSSAKSTPTSATDRKQGSQSGK